MISSYWFTASSSAAIWNRMARMIVCSSSGGWQGAEAVNGVVNEGICFRVELHVQRSIPSTSRYPNRAHSSVTYPCNNLFLLSSGKTHGLHILTRTDLPPSSSCIHPCSILELPTRDSGIPINTRFPNSYLGHLATCAMNRTRGSFSYFHLL